MAPPSELLEMCEQSLEKMGVVFDDSNVYMLHMMYQAMGICIHMQDADGAISYGEKILKPYMYEPLQKHGTRPTCEDDTFVLVILTFAFCTASCIQPTP